MRDLENFINNDEFSDYDDLVKMALIHRQFESSHPVYDGDCQRRLKTDPLWA
jgi:Fic family protein